MEFYKDYLLLNELKITHSDIKLIFEDDSKGFDPMKVADYDIDFDLMFSEVPKSMFEGGKNISENVKALFSEMALNINDIDEPKEGYSIYVRATGIFFYDEKMDVDYDDYFKHTKAVSVLVGYLRSHILNVTSQFIIPPYKLPITDAETLVDMYYEKMGIEPDDEEMDEIIEKLKDNDPGDIDDIFKL